MSDPPYPRLDDIVKADDVAKKGGSGFQAEYVNWARIAHYLREHAPGWQPAMVPYKVEKMDNGTIRTVDVVHRAPDGTGYLLIYFQKGKVETTPVPHAIMDNRNNAKKEIDARDVSDAFVRGMCKAAALLFGLGWKLWSKDDPMGREDPKDDAAPRGGGRGSSASKKTKETGEAITEGQRKMYHAQSRDLKNRMGEDDYKEWIKNVYAVNDLPSVKPTDLTKFQMSVLIDAMVERMKGFKEGDELNDAFGVETTP